MDFLSETTKKEKRNLLATGFAGILVSQLEILPSEMNVVGLKFYSSNLPLLAIAGLCVAIYYFLIKFWSSYLYEQSSAKAQALAMRIREGKTALDIAREEEALNAIDRHLIVQEQLLAAQQEHENKRLATLQEQIDQEDLAHEMTLNGMDQQRDALEEALATKVYEPVAKYLGNPRRISSQDTTESRIQQAIKRVDENRQPFIRQRELKKQNDVESLEDEKKKRKVMIQDGERKLISDGEAASDKRKSIIAWKRTHTIVGIVSPLHRALEYYLPIGIGVFAIISLIYLMLHFTPPKPLSLPEF